MPVHKLALRFNMNTESVGEAELRHVVVRVTPESCRLCLACPWASRQLHAT